MREFTFILIYIFILVRAGFAQEASVLAQGDWYKIAITEPGIYSITYNDLLAMGVDPATVNPRQIALYGNGGSMLPQNNSVARPVDLIENPIWVIGEEDGAFSQEDKIVFYGEGPHVWVPNDTKKGKYEHVFNIYSDTSYYFLLINKQTNGKRIESIPSYSGTGFPINTYDERIFYEKDLINVNETGRIWLGETFDTNLDQTFRFNVAGIAGNTFIMNLAVAGRSTRYNSGSTESRPFMNVYLDQEFVDTVKFSTNVVLSENQYVPVTHRVVREYTFTRSVGDNQLSVRLKYDKNGVLSPSTPTLYAGFLDFIELFFERTLDVNRQSQLMFRSLRTKESGVFTFSITDSQNSYVWDITDPICPKLVTTTFNGEQSVFSTEGGQVREYIAFREYKSPHKYYKVPNQNIRGQTSPDMVIFTAPGLKSQAERLANFHRSNNYLVYVLTTDEVYNEFSSGKRDLSAIRDLCRYFYSNGGNLKYLTLFGLGSHDYKSTIGDAANYIPIYQSRESFSPLSNYASDDYFAFLEDDEGEWLETSSRAHHHTMDIAVGRFPVSNLKEAEICVDKVISYSTSPDFLGRWRSNIAFLADDGEDNIFLVEAERYSGNLDLNNPEFSAHKLYFARYKKVRESGGENSVDLTRELTRVVNEGALIVNYTGHGVPRRLAIGLIDREKALLWKNKNKLAFFITGTCEFALADKPGVYSLGREIFLFKDYGAIGIFSGTRAAYANSNNLIVRNVMKNILNPEMSVGEVLRLAKNESFSGMRNRHFTYLGDPAIRLNVPENRIRLVSLTDLSGSDLYTLKALARVQLKGEVYDREDKLLNDFNGLVHVTIFDKEKKVTTLGQGEPVVTFTERTGELYSGQTQVVNGEFQLELVLPVQAADSIGSAKIRMYAVSDDGRDALGADLNYQTGGISPDIGNDFSEPEIIMYLDSVAFKNGDTVSTKPVLVAELFDESGINLSTTDPDNIMLSYLNEDSIIILTNYFVPDQADYRKGILYYPFYGLRSGSYNLTVRVSDIHNNQSEASVNFVVYDEVTGIFHPRMAEFIRLNAYPNPFDNVTYIRPGESEGLLLADVRISDMQGRLIKGMTGMTISSSNPLMWDGRDEVGRKVAQGVYACTITVPEQQKQYTVLLVVK